MSHAARFGSTRRAVVVAIVTSGDALHAQPAQAEEISQS
jgi:hypothetical protein